MEEDTFKKLNSNFKTPSLNTSYNLNSPVLNTEPCVNVSRLKSIYCQNVTSILNNPEFSFIDEVITKFQRMDTYSGKELKKLSDLSPKSIRCGKRKSKLLKEEKEVSFEEYVNKIEKCYYLFKRNHKKQINPELNSTMTIIEDSNISSYRRNSLNIPVDYLSLNYKLNDNLLNMNVEKMFVYSEELTEKCGELDYQMNKLLFNSPKLNKYINDNYELLDGVDFFHRKIQKFKTSNKLLKNKLLMNSLSTIKLGCKKSNLNKIQIVLSHIKILYDNLAQMKQFTEDSNKIQDFFEIHNKSIYIIDLLREDKLEITILSHIEKEIEEKLKKVTNRLYGDLVQFSMDQLFKSVVYSEFIPIEGFNKDISLTVYNEKFEFDLSIFKQSLIIQILSNIDFPQISEDFQPKLNEILSYVYRVDVDLGLKIRNLLKKIFYDEMMSAIKNLSELFIDAYGSLLNKKIDKEFFTNLEKIDKIFFLFLINKIYKVLFTCLDFILNCIKRECIKYLKELNVENEQIVEYEDLYSEEMQQIRKICSEEMTKVIEKYISNIFDSSSILPLNSFLENYLITSIVLMNNSILNKTFIENSLAHLQESYIFDFFAEKIEEINIAIDNEEWKEINFQQDYQTIVNLMTSSVIQDLKGKQKLEILNEFNKNDLHNNELSEQVIGVSNEKYKIINSILVIIKFLFDSEKLIMIIDNSFSEIISQKIVKLIRDYSNKCSYMIIGGEAYKLKKLSINQKNICVYLSSIIFLRDLSIAYTNTISSIIGKNIIGIEGLFTDLKTNIDSGKQKLLDLSLDIISQSFTLVSFDWQKDSSSNLKDKIEKFFNKQKTVLTIYTAITNYLPQNLSLELASIIINNLVQNYKKSFSEMVKIESKNNAKQFRILMEKVKKLIEYFKINDSNIYYEIFDDYINNYAPKPAEKEKTTEKNDD